MGNKKKTGRPSKKSIFIGGILLLCVILAQVQYAVLVYADKGPIDVTVTVTSPPIAESYGASIAASSGVVLPGRALGEPDGKGALMFRRSWVSIELEGTVKDCSDISVWVAKRGWRSHEFKLYASSDGSTWIYVGSGTSTSGRYTRYDFAGTFGEVKYIKFERDKWWRWSIMSLDAVWAKGGDA